ncbi:TPA: hypothetical protein ACWX5B_003116, partial [Stenotrophomonas maltophilia]
PLTGSVCGQPTEKEKEDQGQQRVAALVGSARTKKAASGPLFFAFVLIFFLRGWTPQKSVRGWGR